MLSKCKEEGWMGWERVAQDLNYLEKTESFTSLCEAISYVVKPDKRTQC